MKKTLLLVFFTMFTLTALADKVKVACVGNSVTYGYKLENRERDAYPSQLQRMLGDGYEVGNFGKSGATLLRRGHRPYLQQEEYQQAKAFGASIVVIHLGLNDTDPRDWPNYRDDFEADYQALIDSLQAAAPGGKIEKLIVCRMTPIFHGHSRFESGTRDWHKEIQAAIDRVALRNGIEALDIFTPLHSRPDLFPDNLHPNPQGAEILAKTVYGGITGDWGGLSLPEVFSSGMVLQHDKAIINGRANAGAAIQLTVKGPNRFQLVRSVTADTNGRWTIDLGSMRPGGPYTIKVEAKDSKEFLAMNGRQKGLEKTQSILLDDVLAGEVWLCSGQSNMAFRLDQCATASTDIPAAKSDLIRLFDMRERWQTGNEEWPAAALDSLNNLCYYKPTVWAHCTPETAAKFSAIGYHFGRVLADSLRMPVGLICNAIGGSTTEAWVDRTTIESEFPALLRPWQNNDFIQDWCRGRASKNLAKVKSIYPADKVDEAMNNQRHPYLPCYLFETGIAPLSAFPIKGVVWYQGESNAHNKEAHDKLFTLMVDSWRQNWNNLGMPIYFVQLSSLNRPSWPWFRDSQRILQNEIRNTGMVVTTDIGDSLDVHPRYKKEVGERLARYALNERYGYDKIIPSGPLPIAAVFGTGAATVYVDYGKGMQGRGGEPIRTFELAGTDGIFFPAEAEITNDHTLRITSPDVAEPVSVRYGWQPFTRANLVNSDDLPMTTFRLDKKN